MTSPSAYAYPPLVPEDPLEIARRMAESLGSVWDEVTAAYERVLTSANELRKAETLKTLEELQDAVARFQARTLAEAEQYARVHVPTIYAGQAARYDPGFTWTGIHQETAQQLAADSYADLLRRSEEAGRTSDRFAREVRKAARERVPFQATGRKTARQVGEELRERLEARGLSVATYANGRQVSMRTYTEMAVRTKTGVAHNLGTLRGLAEMDVEWVEVFDGSDCGWRTHDDPDKANGTIRKAKDAEAHLLSHPQCRRAFGGRPDITSAKEAKEANLSTSAAQREDQRLAEERQRTPRAARRERLQAKRAARLQPAPEPISAERAAQNLVEAAKAAEPALTALNQRLAKENGGTLAGLDFRLKGEGSLTRKITGDVAEGKGTPEEVARMMWDVNRYTQVFPPGRYAQGSQQVLDSLRAEGNVLKVKNYWNVDTNPYQGINVQVLSPEGRQWELQFHTKNSLDVKEGPLHHIYEARRIETDPVKAAALDAESFAVAAKIRVPPGVADVG